MKITILYYNSKVELFKRVKYSTLIFKFIMLFLFEQNLNFGGKNWYLGYVIWPKSVFIWSVGVYRIQSNT